MRLRDKVVIVTGSTSGIGEAIARRFVEEGARVLVHGLEVDLARSVAGLLGEAAAFHACDLADPPAAERLAEAARSAFGRIDAIVNNAGRVARGTVETTDAAAFDSVMAVNARAPLLLIRAALEDLTRAKGSVLNIGSVNADRMLANVTEAAEQCERLTVPEVREAAPLAKLLDTWPRGRRLLFAAETRDGLPIAEGLAAERAKMPEPWAILIGPEGGFAPEELARIRAVPGVVPVSLGSRLLRADTAALAALAVWQAVMGAGDAGGTCQTS